MVESLRSINYNGPFDPEAHDSQNSLNLKSKFYNSKLHPISRGTKLGLKTFMKISNFHHPKSRIDPESPAIGSVSGISFHSKFDLQEANPPVTDRLAFGELDIERSMFYFFIPTSL